MKELTLQQEVIVLYIAGNRFTVVPDSALADTIASLSCEAERLAFLASGSNSFSGTRKFLCCAVNSLIGENAVDAIFGDREPDIFDLCDIISYICERFSDYRKKRLDRLRRGESSPGKEEIG